jgi:hypothetical protein
VQKSQSGSAYVELSNSQIDFIAVSLSGPSRLNMANIAPLLSANIAVNGSSQITLSIMDGGTLTGSAAGSSQVGYLGGSVNMLVETFDTASATWLGQL